MDTEIVYVPSLSIRIALDRYRFITIHPIRYRVKRFVLVEISKNEWLKEHLRSENPFMASSMRLNPSCFSYSYSSAASKSHRKSVTVIQCGPRDNRGPLLRGRILSIEAIQAVQALKRAERVNETQIDQFVSKTLSRLIKQDLLATLKELLRQGRCHLALKVFKAARSELWYKTDCSLYADMVTALAKSGMMEEIDHLISVDLERDGLDASEERGLSRLVKALIAAERTELVIRVYGLMKRCGWVSATAVSASAADEYVVKILSRGLRRLGEERVADEVEKDLMNSVSS